MMKFIPRWPRIIGLSAIVMAIFFARYLQATNASNESVAKITRIMTIGSEKANEDFYSPRSFTIDKNGNVFILDSGNSRIQCFSPSGIFRFSFGRFGQGPGELSKEASMIKILDDGNIYVIDNLLRRINKYDINGKIIKTYATNARYDDIVLLNGEYYLSNLILRVGYSPISRTENLSDIRYSFGSIVEPTPGIIDIIQKSPFGRMLENEFTFMNMTSLTSDKKGAIFYSQLQPYYISKYADEGNKAGDLFQETGFDTHFPLVIHFSGNSVHKKVTGPVPIVYAPILRKDGGLLVPIISPDRSYFLFDLFDDNCSFLKRFRLHNSIYDFNKSAGITNIIIDDNDVLYCLIISREDNPVLSINKIFFE
jgi:hypothetical protein